jgi:hypothetical protein
MDLDAVGCFFSCRMVYWPALKECYIRVQGGYLQKIIFF